MCFLSMQHYESEILLYCVYISRENYFNLLYIFADDLNILSAIYSQLGSAYLRLGNLLKAITYYQHDCTLAQ